MRRRKQVDDGWSEVRIKSKRGSGGRKGSWPWWSRQSVLSGRFPEVLAVGVRSPGRLSVVLVLARARSCERGLWLAGIRRVWSGLVQFGLVWFSLV